MVLAVTPKKLNIVEGTYSHHPYLAISRTLTGALMANRLSYLGAAYSVLVMLLIIMDVCRIQRTGKLTALLVGLSTAAFLLAASDDWIGLYYEAVSIETVNGMTKLVKDYGPCIPSTRFICCPILRQWLQ